MRNEATTSKNTWKRSNKKISFWSFGHCDHLILFLALGLAAFGLVMVYSASYIYAQERYGDGLHYFRRHLVFLLIGVGCMTLIRFINYRIWEKLAWPLFLLSCIGLIMVQIPGLNHHAGGAKRWINLGFTTVQPIEFAKIALIIFLASLFSRNQGKQNINLRKDFLVKLSPIVAIAFLSLIQPDFGSAVLITITGGMLFYLAGVRLRYLVVSAMVVLPMAGMAILMAPYRRARLFTFLDPWADPQNAGFQIIQSFLAFHRGGLFGVGLGNSKEKLFYLPEAHNDFILSVVGEELGFLGMLLLSLAFVFFLFRAVRISAKSANQFGALLAGGLAILLGLEVFMNAGVVLGMLPTKGMNLPFVSSGGSSIIAAMIAVGLLLSISAAEKVQEDSA